MERFILGVFTFELGGAAAWVQAIGSVGAIFASYLLFKFQHDRDVAQRKIRNNEERIGDLSAVLTCIGALIAQVKSLANDESGKLTFPVAISRLNTAGAATQMFINTLQGFAVSNKADPKASAQIYGAIQSGLNFNVLIQVISVANTYQKNNVEAWEHILLSLNRNYAALNIFKVKLGNKPDASFPDDDHITKVMNEQEKQAG